MRKLMVLVISALVISAAASAAPLCVNTMTLATLIGTDGCQVQDKLFNNWSYSGGGNVAAANVGINVIFGTPVSGIDIHGFTFAPTPSGPGLGGVWVADFTIGYTISVLPESSFYIVGATDQFMLGPLSNVSIARSLKGPGGTIATLNLNQANPTQSVMFTGVKSLQSLTTVTVPPGSGLNFVASLEEDYIQSNAIPEPMTFGLIGTGLLALGLIRRRARKS